MAHRYWSLALRSKVETLAMSHRRITRPSGPPYHRTYPVPPRCNDCIGLHRGLRFPYTLTFDLVGPAKMELEENRVSSSSSSESMSDASENEEMVEKMIEEDGETSVVLVPRSEVS